MENLNTKEIDHNEVNMIWNTMLSNIQSDTDKIDIELTKIVSKAIARLAPATIVNF